MESLHWWSVDDKETAPTVDPSCSGQTTLIFIVNNYINEAVTGEYASPVTRSRIRRGSEYGEP